MKKFYGDSDALRAEVMAMKERLGLAQYLVIRAIILEVDAKIVLESFKALLIYLTKGLF